ncbi:SGNH/GDSL hydrolase family protein [Stenotrophomonas sp. RG-453]|nr:SGNH/GDSL hydrolase family protein [Stenotrophomonas sp. RG-453]
MTAINSSERGKTVAEKELSQYPSIEQIGSSTRLAVIENGRNAQVPAAVLGDFVGVQIEASGLPSDVEALKAGQQTSSIYKATLAELQATPGSYAGQGGFVPGVGQFSWSGSAWQLIASDVLADKANQAPVNALLERVGAIDSGVYYRALGDLPTGNQGLATDFSGVGRAFVSTTAVISSVAAWISPAASATKLRVRVYSRSGTGAGLPGSGIDSLQREVVVPLEGIRTMLGGTGPVMVRAKFAPLQVGTKLPTLVTFEALDDSNAPAFIGYYTVAAPAGYHFGYVKSASSGNWIALGSTAAVLAMIADHQAESIPGTTVGYTDVSWVEPNSHDWENPTFAGWARSFVGQAGMAFNAVSAYLSNMALGDLVQVRVFARKSSESASPNLPGSPGIQDMHLGTFAFPVSAITGAAMAGKFYFDVGNIQIPAGRYPLVELAGLLANGTKAALGAGRTDYSSAPADTTWMLPAAGASGFTLLAQNRTVSIGLANNVTKATELVTGQMFPAVAAQGVEIADIKAQLGSIVAGGSSEGMADAAKPLMVINGLTVNLAGSTAVIDGVPVVFGGSFALDPPVAASGSTASLPLKYSQFGAGSYPTQNPNAMLWRRRLSSVVVTRQSDGVVLVQGTDYGVDSVWGKLYGMKNVADQVVDASYNYARERYDLLQLDPVTMTCSVVKGAERDLDAHDYAPVASNRFIPLYYLYVRAGTITPVPVHLYQDGVRKDTRVVFDGMLSKGKRMIGRTRRKLQRGQAVKVLGYGDSITSCGNLDLLWYFETLPPDNRAAIPTYNRADSGVAFATRVSWNWVAIQAVKAAYGYVDSHESNLGGLPVLTYVNKGIGGTNSSGSANNGSNATRLADALASGADVMVLAFGMNEIGSDSTFDNMASIIQQAQAAGMDVLVMGVPKTNAITDVRDIALWRKTNRTLQLVADATGCPFVPINWLTDQGGGGLPVAPEHLCSANYFNHPGLIELKHYGLMLSKFFL